MTTSTYPMEHYLLATEGLALMRLWYLDDEKMSAQLIDEVTQITSSLHSGATRNRVRVTEQPATVGYSTWASTYDQDNQSNPLIPLESEALAELLPPGGGYRALDAACGTGRQEQRLLELGYDVTGVDATPAMLDVARRTHPGVRYLHGDLRALPVGDAEFDLVLSTLAVTHVPELERVIAEFSRVTRSGGSVVIVDVHPVQVLLGAHATVPEPAGGITAVRNSVHLPSRYLAAFAACRLRVRRCLEPRFTDDLVAQLPAAERIPQANRIAFAGTPALLIWALQKEETGEPR